MAVFLDSEIGVLEDVVVHSPGREIEAMTPDTASEVLYNEIIPLSLVSEQHATLKALLSEFSNVRELTGLFSDSIGELEIRKAFIDQITAATGVTHRRAELYDMDPQDLVTAMVTGLKQKKDTVSSVLSGMEFDIPPLPNLYFMRDGAATFRDGVIVSAMAHRVRSPESLIMSYVFSHHPDVGNCRIHYNGAVRSDEDFTIEGGDVVIAGPNLLLIGISERTTAKAVDYLAVSLSSHYNEPISILAVVLPKKRATIHLDMIFTFLDHNEALIYEPYVTGSRRLPVMRLDADPNGITRVTEFDGIIEALSASGMHMDTVLCGGTDPLLQQREQWLSAANVFAVAPGKIIGYDCNSATAEELSNAGYEVTHARDVLSGNIDVDGYEKVFIGIPGVELARGGGGVRCMTMPLKRRTVS